MDPHFHKQESTEHFKSDQVAETQDETGAHPSGFFPKTANMAVLAPPPAVDHDHSYLNRTGILILSVIVFLVAAGLTFGYWVLYKEGSMYYKASLDKSAPAPLNAVNFAEKELRLAAEEVHLVKKSPPAPKPKYKKVDPLPEPKVEKAEPIVARQATPLYTIQAAAAYSKEAAEQEAERLREQGFEEVYIIPPENHKGKVFSVRLGHFETREEADARVLKVRSKGPRDAFVANIED